MKEDEGRDLLRRLAEHLQQRAQVKRYGNDTWLRAVAIVPLDISRRAASALSLYLRGRADTLEIAFGLQPMPKRGPGAPEKPTRRAAAAEMHAFRRKPESKKRGAIKAKQLEVKDRYGLDHQRSVQKIEKDFRGELLMDDLMIAELSKGPRAFEGTRERKGKRARK